MQVKPVVSFYYPSENIGGAQVLFGRVAGELSKKGYRIKVYQHGESFISKFLNDVHVTFEHVTKPLGELFEVDRNEVFVLSLSYAMKVLSQFRFSPDSKFVFWDLNHNCLIDQMVFAKLYKKMSNKKAIKTLMQLFEPARRRKLERFVNSASSTKGLAFMASYDFVYNKYIYGYEVNPKYLSIPVPDRSAIHAENSESAVVERIRIAWMSRLVPEKAGILKLLLRDVGSFNGEDVHIDVIGNGPSKEMLAQYAREVGVKSINFLGEVNPHDLPSLIRERVGIGFSVGTSALEFALNMKATVLMPNKTDAKYYINHEAKYFWLHEMTGMDLATFKGDSKEYYRFSDIIKSYQENVTNISEKSFDYVEKNHALKNVTLGLEKMILNTGFDFKRLKDIRLSEVAPSEVIGLKVRQLIKGVVRV